METTMRRRNLFCLTLLLFSMGTVMVLPATGWLVRLEARTAVGLANPALTVFKSGDNSSSPTRVREVLAREPTDFDLALATTLRGFGPLTNDDETRVTPGTSSRVPELLEPLKAQFPDQPDVYAHQLRYWCLGPLSLRHREPGKKDLPAPAASQHAIWERAEQTAIRGAELDPDNSYFPLMQAMALLAQGKDEEGYRALHTAALRPRYEDYAWRETKALWKLTDRLNGGEVGSVPKMAQMAAVLFPHYAQIRSLARVTAAEATRQEAAGDAIGALSLRHDIAAVGGKMRDQGGSIICNLVGTAMVFIAPSGTPAWGTKWDYGDGEATQRERTRERVAQYVAYLNGLNSDVAREEARFFKRESEICLEAKRVTRLSTNDAKSGFFGWDSQLMNIIRAAAAQMIGILLLTNIGWFLLFGAGAVLLCRTRGIRGGEGFPMRVHLTLWAMGLAAVGTVLFLQMRTILPVGQMLATMGSAEGTTSLIPFLLLGGFSVFVPFVTLAILAIHGKVKKERVVVATAYGVRGVALPMATILGVLFAVLAVWTAGQETRNLAHMSAMMEQGEATFYARMAGQVWPVSPAGQE
jgi:hypothetical protein